MSGADDKPSCSRRGVKPSIKRKQEFVFHINPSAVYPPTKQIHQLTNDEILAYKDVFWKYDVDGSGTIDVKELNEMLKKMGREIPVSDLLDIVAHFDQDESGSIDFPEFLILMANLKLGKEDEEFLEAFNIIDKESKGEIGCSELKAFLAQLECTISEEDLKSMIRMADKTGTGRLTFNEFTDVMKNL